MSHLRRFVLLAVLTLGGGVALTACQSASAPGLAAQVGEVRLTDAQVEDIVKQFDDLVVDQNQKQIDRQQSESPRPSGAPAPEAQGLPTEQVGNIRQRIVELTVFNELARAYVQDKGLAWTRPNYDEFVRQNGLEPPEVGDRTHPDPSTNPYVVLVADSESYRKALSQHAQKAEPTEADLQEAYRRAVASGAVPETVAFEQVKPQLLQFDEIRAGVWLRNELAAVAERIGVTVSPRYQPLEIATGVLSTQSGGQVVMVALPLGETAGSPAVRDAG